VNRIRPGNIALKVLNQYRRRDVLAYLALRYYLENQAARTDDWAQTVATNVVMTRSAPGYFPSEHFKEIDQGKIKHRRIHLPCANEAIAETALLSKCAGEQIFQNPQCVYSYHLAEEESRFGVFKDYFGGLCSRQQAIAAACKADSKSVVRILDIQKCYPSIGLELAHRAWLNACDASSIGAKYRELGLKLLRDYRKIDTQETMGLPTGPMFSHLIANLVLRAIDDIGQRSTTVQYFRYVDDLVLVGQKREVDKLNFELKSRLDDMGLKLHDLGSPKCLELSSSTWLQGKDDFQRETKEVTWLSLLREMKQLLIRFPGKKESLIEAIQDAGMRLPVRDYSNVVKEASNVSWYSRMAKFKWFRKKVQDTSVESVLKVAKLLEQSYREQFEQLIELAPDMTGYERKRCVPKVRFCLSRLLYLARDDELKRLSTMALEMPELVVHAEVGLAIVSGNVEKVLRMGTNVAQAVSQPIRAAHKSVEVNSDSFPVTKVQSLAVVTMNGIPVRCSADVNLPELSPLMRLAINGGTPDLMRSSDGFIREMACLHGMSERVRHSDMIDCAVDEDESLIVDTIDQLNQSNAY
jgi:hypothetical protein